MMIEKRQLKHDWLVKGADGNLNHVPVNLHSQWYDRLNNLPTPVGVLEAQILLWDPVRALWLEARPR